MKYLDRLKKTQKEKDKEKLPFHEKMAKNALERELLETEARLVTLKQQVEDQLSAYPIDFQRLLQAMDERDLKERELKQLSKLKTDLF